MNITLSADKKLIDSSRLYAEKHNTTLNNLVREYLKHITNKVSAGEAALEFQKHAKMSGGKSPSSYKFSRNEIYSRGM